MKKLSAFLLACALLLPVLSAISAEAVFRNGITFGDSRETVAEKETETKVSEEEEEYLAYGYFSVAGIPESKVTYKFSDDDMLNAVIYNFRAGQYGEETIYNDYKAVSNTLIAQYGNPLGFINGNHHTFSDNGALQSVARIMDNYQKYLRGPFNFADIIDYNEWDIGCDGYRLKIEHVHYHTSRLMSGQVQNDYYNTMSFVKHPSEEQAQDTAAANADLAVLSEKPTGDKVAVTKAPGLAMPDNGKARYYTARKNEAPFEVTTPAGDEYHYIILTDIDKVTKILSFVVYPGETVSVEVPLGKYRLFYATGMNWYGDDDLFGKETRYYETGDVLEFYKTEVEIMYQSVELIKQEGGNLETDPISESDFPK